MKRKSGIAAIAVATFGVICLAAIYQPEPQTPVISAPSGHIISADENVPFSSLHELVLQEMKNETEEDVEDEDTIEIAPEVEDERVYLGTYRISHYCPCRKCNGGYTTTASGEDLQPNVTVAVDRNKIALGSTLYIDGYGERVAHDTGGAIKGERIDVCVGSHDEAYELGVVYRDVYLIKC